MVMNLCRRGYASAAQSGGVTRGVAPNLMLKKGPEEAVDTAWVPDPTTGFYRPGNAGNGVDPAELRAMLLKKKTRSEQ